MKKHLKYVCLGGGIGTVNVLKGIKDYSKDISVLVSMADDGGSAGRLRRLFSIPPPGDLMNCIAALSDAEPLIKDLLTYRFKGNRWGRDDSLGGQKLGNLILVALSNLTGSFEKGLEEAQRLFLTHGQIIPATKENVSIWAMTIDGKKINGEQNIDLGKYDGARSLTEVHLEPKNPTTSKEAVDVLKNADVIIAGPGDLYTTILPVLLAPQVKKELFESRAKKIFVVNVANKPFETPNYSVSEFITAVIKHIDGFPFDYILVNNNFNKTIPKKLKYTYVLYNELLMPKVKSKVIQKNLVNESFPLYHDPEKLGKTITNLL